MYKLAIIPARGGSKRIPRKNIKLFLGKPIIAYSIEAALESRGFDEVMVSTDDQEIAEIARRYGAQVPFLRSAELSTDTAGTAPVLVEVVREYQRRGKDFHYICCVFPAAPFITAQRLIEAMSILVNENVDGVLPIVRYSHPPQRALQLRNNRVEMIHPENYSGRSQDFEPIYHDCGLFYCLNVPSLMVQQKLICANTWPMVIPEHEVQDIDNRSDWILAEYKYHVLRERQG